MFKRLFASFLVVAMLFSFSEPAYAGIMKAVGKGAATFVIVKAVKYYGKKKGIEAAKKVSAYIIKKVKHQDIQTVGKIFNSVRQTAFKYAAKHPEKPYLRDNAEKMLANLARALAQKGRVIPNWTYRSVNGYKDDTDSLGRLMNVSGKIRLKKAKEMLNKRRLAKKGFKME